MTNKLGELKEVHLLIEAWYQKESDKVHHQSRIDEFQAHETTTLYHHELIKNVIKKSSILRLKTEEGLIEGHSKCAKYLEQTVEDLLLSQPDLSEVAQDTLLTEVKRVFTDKDNEVFLKLPTKEAVLKVLLNWI